jgi:DNA sulfur modification protein DndD
MRISIVSIKSDGLRCPDFDINLKFHDKLKKINLIQMPNGTGKTTIEELIKLTLSGENPDKEVVKNFRNPTTKPASGSFSLKVEVEDTSNNLGIIEFRLSFDFSNGGSSFNTNSDDYTSSSNGKVKGMIEGHSPPAELKPFLQKDIVDIFNLEGPYVKRLLSKDETQARTAIEAFTGINILQRLQDEVDAYYKKSTRGAKAGTTDSSLKKHEQDHQSAEKRKLTLEKELQKAKLARAMLDKEYTELHSTWQGNLKNNEDLNKLKEAKLKTDKALTISSKSLLNLLKDPMQMSSQVTKVLDSFNKNLGKLKLPSHATGAFFEELCDNPKCVCGNKMTDEMRLEIQNNSKTFLSEEYNSILNSVKSDIKRYQDGGSSKTKETALKEFRDTLQESEKAEDNYQTALSMGAKSASAKVQKMYQRLIDIQLLSQDEKRKIDELEAEYSEDVKKDLNVLKEKGSTSIESIKKCEKIIYALDEKIAAIKGNQEALKAKEMLNSILETAIHRTRNKITEELVTSINKALKKLMPGDENLEVVGISNCIELKQSGASQGQRLAIAYSFVTSLLERSNHKFPLLVDHPFQGLQEESINDLSKLLPKVCHQFIGFLVNVEKIGSLYSIKGNKTVDSGFRLTKEKIFYATAFRKSDQTKKLEPPAKLSTETKNGIACYDQSFFDNFNLQDEK